MDKALKKLNEEKNTINCDIDMIRHSTVTLLMMMIIIMAMANQHIPTSQIKSPPWWGFDSNDKSWGFVTVRFPLLKILMIHDESLKSNFYFVS